MRRRAAGSRAFVRVTIEFAHDTGQSGLRLTEIIPAVAVAAEAAGLAKFVERAGDFAAVLAADGFDDISMNSGDAASACSTF